MQLHNSLELDALLKNQAIRKSLAGIRRGIEKEALRITPQGKLATTPHPEQTLGATLTHPAITTDYAESLVELITPVSNSVEETLAQLRDLHKVMYRAIGDEYLWPLSMPCYVNDVSDIQVANYGSSHIGTMKTVYRIGLTHRYGAMMQTIAGVHYNFSISDDLWAALADEEGDRDCIEFRSAKYLGLVRNFKRFAWVIPYLFGASPMVCQSFLRHSSEDYGLEDMGNGLAGLPYATCLRMSDLGYTNKSQSTLRIVYNSLEEYADELRHAVFTPDEDFVHIGTQDESGWKQLSGNILQIENEFYSTIRPKQIALAGETPTQALERGGVEYVEVRLIDVNPFSQVGITADQMRFLDLFLLYCLLNYSPSLEWEQQQEADAMLDTVVKHGRQPGLNLTDQQGTATIEERLEPLFKELTDIAIVMDEARSDSLYSQSLEVFRPAISDPERTLSGQVAAYYQAQFEQGGKPGMHLAQKYKQELIEGEFEFYTQDQFDFWTQASIEEKKELEADSVGSFGDFLEDYFTQAKTKKSTL